MPTVWADNSSLAVASLTNTTGWSARFDSAQINNRLAAPIFKSICHPERVKRVEGSWHDRYCTTGNWCEDPSTMRFALRSG